MDDTNWHYHKLHNKLLKISCNNSYSWTCNFWINFIHEYQHFTHNRWYLYIIMIFLSKCIFRKFFYKVFLIMGMVGMSMETFIVFSLSKSKYEKMGGPHYWWFNCHQCEILTYTTFMFTWFHVHFLMLKWSPSHYIFAYFFSNLNLTSSNF